MGFALSVVKGRNSFISHLDSLILESTTIYYLLTPIVPTGNFPYRISCSIVVFNNLILSVLYLPGSP